MKQLWWWGLVLVWMGMIWYLSDQPNLSSGLEADWWLRKGAHITEYAILTWLWWQAAGRRGLWWVIWGVIAYAVSDEIHQSFVVGRHGSALDVVIDSTGAVIMTGLIKWARKFNRNPILKLL